ncbi:hypothetical protein SK128_025531, partial [Halocaridina rubra]
NGSELTRAEAQVVVFTMLDLSMACPGARLLERHLPIRCVLKGLNPMGSERKGQGSND